MGSNFGLNINKSSFKTVCFTCSWGYFSNAYVWFIRYISNIQTTTNIQIPFMFLNRVLYVSFSVCSVFLFLTVSNFLFSYFLSSERHAKQNSRGRDIQQIRKHKTNQKHNQEYIKLNIVCFIFSYFLIRHSYIRITAEEEEHGLAQQRSGNK